MYDDPEPQNGLLCHNMKIEVGLLGIWLTCYLFFIASVGGAENDVCQTSDGLRGICIQLPRCQRLFDMYSQPRPLPRATIQLLRAEQCGAVLRQPLVCCRDDSPVTTVQPDTSLLNPEFCGQTFADRIVGGNKTGIFEMPWMVLLKYRSTKGKASEESFKCGGSLISKRYVLTAAHCISNSSRLRLLSVRLGDHDTTTDEDCEDQVGTRVCAPPPQNIDVQSFVRHPSYNPTTLVNDIALIRLATEADTSKDTINPICLPVEEDLRNKNLDNEKLIVAGWGFTESGSPSSDLLKVALPVMPNERCKTVFQQFDLQVGPNQLCAGGTNLTQDSCRGDSGGPLKTSGTVNGESGMVQFGVVSYGHRHCGTEGVPGVYTRVGPYMNWILDNMRP